MRRIPLVNSFVRVLCLFFITALFAAVFFVPHTASAATLTVVTATTTSSNASTTLAKIGDTVQFGLQLSGTPVATSTPVINIGSMGTTSMTGSGAWWSYSTTTSASWSQGALQFRIGFGDSAPGINNATTTVTQTSLTGPNVTFDSIAPTLSIVSIASNNSSTTLAKVGDTITVTATSSENIRIPTITIISQSAAFSLITGSTTWKGTYTIVQGDTEGVAPFSISYTDSAGNSSSDSPKTAITTGSNVTVDTTAPSISVTGSSPDSVSASSLGYTDPGATVSDSREGSINSALVTTGSVNRAVPGTYTLTYTASDSAGNAATAATRTVTVNHVGNGGIFTGNASNLPGYEAPRPQIIHADGRVEYLDQGVSVAAVVDNRSFGAASPRAVPVFTRTLRRGSQSEEIRALQKLLATDTTLYPEALITGYFGAFTERAVQRFQAKYGIVSEGTAETTGYGLVGPKTRVKLTQIFTE